MEQNNKSFAKKGILKLITVFVIGLTIGMTLCLFIVNRTVLGGNIDVHAKLAAVIDVLDKYYLYDYSKEELADTAALGAVLSVKDPYTVYYSKAEFSDMQDSSNGDFIGIGATVGVDASNEIQVLEVTENSPADDAGVMAGDVMVKIEGEAYTGDDLDEAVSIIRGIKDGKKIGVDVNITVRRENEHIDLIIKRDVIHTDSVYYKLLDNNIGYIKIDSFITKGDGGKDTADEFKEALDTLILDGANKLIFDVRDNGGGDADVVSKTLDILLPEGVIMYTEDKYGRREETKSYAGEINLPMAVITNGMSASAAEVFTGALKDFGKATVVGEKTYGKGVVQVVVPLADGSGVRVTYASYYTPNGTKVHGEGIMPDIEIKLDKDNKEDTQLQTAIEVLSK